MAIQNKDIAAIRADYSLGKLSEDSMLSNPIEQFQNWFNEALNAEVLEVNAFVLATVSPEGMPSSRILLLKDIQPDGFSFFTNYSSRKGKEIEENPKVSALFFWPELQRQVRIQGFVERLPAADSDAYFQSRPKGSRIGALASPQSQEIINRTVLEHAVEQLTAQYQDEEHIPRPAHWGGYIIHPLSIEFWQGRSSRLHDRIVYKKVADSWKIVRIAP
ncbi:pyridoxamine 5'-phosphate oxidase [Sphingobacteriaceae bacterium WQ 2009]|uniref:Pyridoxine/pyridoxamine 5'-phosphate oxidase n=1 Tax=Rhinopithecimicrobium faecis TaxID=2820698 RepID=A0A8T4HB94_9SPHI|nr:pyridoxamine 5'-phosphate oxidase [Sphingobacteriaceae bacterium WQ 2009]